MDEESLDFNLIIHSSLYKSLINAKLFQIYNFQVQGINRIINDTFNITNKKVILTQTRSLISSNIKIFIIELKFLRTNNKIIKNNFYTYCVECGKMHAQHKYKKCGHYVNLLCAYQKVMYNNKCTKCNKKIVKKDVKLCKTNKIDKCPICLEDCNTVLEKCGHHFHSKCIKIYCKTNKNELTCPLCRTNLFNVKDCSTFNKNMSFSLPDNKSGLVDVITQKI